MHYFQEISNGRTHVSRAPKKPEYLIARSQLTERGLVGFVPIQFLMDDSRRYNDYTWMSQEVNKWLGSMGYFTYL